MQPTLQGKLVKETMCLETLKAELEQVYIMAENREYEQAGEKLEKAAVLLERLQKFMEEEDGEETT